MRNERGITLIALIIYVILMTFVVAGISAITTSFYGNMNLMDETSESAVAFSKFNMYFINDIKSKNVKIATSDSGGSGTSLTMSMTNDKGKIQTVTYAVRDDGIYRENVKVCDKVKSAEFTTGGTNKNVVTVNIKFKNYEKTTSYILEPKIVEDNTPII